MPLDRSTGATLPASLPRMPRCGWCWRCSTFGSGGVLRSRTLATRYASTSTVAALLWLVSCFVAAPERFWLWALALTIDLGTPLVSTRHLIEVPHDAAH